MTQVLRPDGLPGWRAVLGVAAGTLAISTVVALVRSAPLGAAVAGVAGTTLLAAAVAAVVVGAARASRLVVDGARVEHRQLLRRRRVEVGPGWRLVEYRRGAGRSMTWVWVLFDPQEEPRLLLNGALWSRPLLVEALAGPGVTVTSEVDGHRVPPLPGRVRG